MNIRILTPALIGMLLCASASSWAQNLAAAEPAVPALSGPAPRQPVAAAPVRAADAAPGRTLAPEATGGGPAVPNVPRQVTPESVAAPPQNSPDASRIDASDGKSLDASPDAGTDVSEGKSLDAAPDTTVPNDEADAVVATINDEPISEFELRQRIALCIATATCPQPRNDEDKKRIRARILEGLEEEKMQFQEAQKKHITVSPVEVDRVVNRIIAENRISLEQMNKVLNDAGASMEAFRTQLTAQLAWQKAVQDQFSGDDVKISPAEVDAEMARVAEGANRPHYLVGEIFLPVDNSDQDAKVQKDAQGLETQLQSGAPFQGVARQFSQSPTAVQGGDIGWVYDGQLATDLNAALTTMKKGDISKPIRSVGGYYILQLQDRQEPLGTKIADVPTAATVPTGNLKLGRLLLPLAGATEADMETAKKIAAQVRAGYAGCEKLAELPKQLPGAVYFDMGDTKLSDISPEIRKAIEDTKPGEMAAPMMDEAGIELIGRCDAKVEVRTAFTMPTRDQVQNQLFDQQISALARRYLRDIKRDANVEVR